MDSDILTFVSSIDFRFADEGRTVAHVAAQKHIGWVGVASTNIARHVLTTSAIVALMLITPTSEKAIPLQPVFGQTTKSQRFDDQELTILKIKFWLITIITKIKLNQL